MTNKLPLRTISILCCLALLGLALPILAQTPAPPTPREALIQAIQARAQRDVELGKSPEGIAGLEILFGAEAANVGLSMAEVLAIYEEAYTAATPVKPWWADLRPEAGWIVAIILFVLFIIRDVLEDNLKKFVNWLWECAYLQLAGYRPLWWIALRRYRRALVTRYEQLKIPFRPGRPLEMREVYVPLKVQGAHDTDLIKVYHAVAEYKWLMIVGAPGAGKTMLLKRLALHYAEDELADFPSRPVPVLLELNRLSESKDPLETHLAQVLKDNDFPGGERFIKAGLEHGPLLLLLDGLDEVARDARGRVVQQIKDLLQAHPKIRAVITCRTAVYDGEFDDLVQQRLEIAEFSDQQIQRFLGSWQPQMPPGKSTEHLLRNLRERPRIRGLARNPLLLTIIAYLYTDTPFVLPHSRTAFYDKALAVLLEQWDQVKGTPNHYTADEKRLVLQHLALFNQDNSEKRGRDRRSIDLPTVLAEIARVLPSVSRKAEDARPLLDEIVARSGLLLALDGGLRYQFAHLTLQEFFAAQKLQDDAAALLARFRADSDAWRETLKLWCGLPHDSTGLIRALYADHPILAFECLGDAQQVGEALADEIITTFQARLGEDGVTGEAVTRVFAAVATNPQRGEQIFEFLAATMKDTAAVPTRRRAAAQALALSNLPQAAAVLAECVLDYPDARSLLAQMGDLATPALTEWARQDHEWAFDALQTVGTFDAARVLTEMLWSEGNNQAYRAAYLAAWRLATLFDKPIIEDALRAYPLTEAQRKAESLEWVWSPFEPDPKSSLRVIAGRIAYLLFKTPRTVLLAGEPQPLDPRLLIPVCVIAVRADEFGYCDQALLSFLFRCLDVNLQTELKPRLAKGKTIPTINDWRNIHYQSEYDFAQSWHARGLKALLMSLLILAVLHLGETIVNVPQVWSWVNVFNVFWGLCLIGVGLRLARTRWTLDSVDALSTLLIFGGNAVFGSVFGFLSGNWLSGAMVGAMVGAVGGAVGDAVGGTVGGAVGGVVSIAVSGAVGGAVSIAVGGAVGGAVAGAVGDTMGGAMVDAMLDVFLITGGVVGVAVGGAVGGAVAIVVCGPVCGTAGVFVGLLVTAIVVLRVAAGGTVSSAVAGAIVGVMASAVVGAVIYGPSLFVYGLGGLWGLAAFWGIWLTLALALYWRAKRCQRAAENPLHGLLPDAGPTPVAAQRRGWMAFLPGGSALPMPRLRKQSTQRKGDTRGKSRVHPG